MSASTSNVKKTKQGMLNQFGWKILDKNKQEDALQIKLIAAKKKFKYEARVSEMVLKRESVENAAMAAEEKAQLDYQLFLNLEGTFIINHVTITDMFNCNNAVL